MERAFVTSTTISSIGYDPEDRILEVEFLTGSVYQYLGVPQEQHDGIMNSDSKGKYLHHNIKNSYTCVKL